MIYSVNTGSYSGPTPSYIELSFSWTPSTLYFYSTYSEEGSAPAAPAHQQLTFTASPRIIAQGGTLPDGLNSGWADLSGPLSIVEYRWDFGDGVIGYGNPVTHTYNQAYPLIFTTLRVTDSQGRQWFCRASMYLDMGTETPYTLSAANLAMEGVFAHRVISHGLSASLILHGDIVNQFGATVSASGTLNRRLFTQRTGSIGVSGAASRQTILVEAANLASAGSIGRSIYLEPTAQVNLTGGLDKTTENPSTASATFSGALSAIKSGP